MGKYVLEEYVLNGFNASSKAREDVSKFLLDYGFESVARNDKSNVRTKVGKSFLALKVYWSLILKLKKDDVLFLQTSIKVLDGILRIREARHFKIVYLIHDVFSIRYDDQEKHKNEIKQEINALNKCDFVICHNTAMKERLRSLGCKSDLIELEIFDYRVSSASTPRQQDITVPSLAFAGNIAKSPFLTDLDARINRINVNVYGNPSSEFQNLTYKGALPAEELPQKIEGMYGLIWEGDYIAQVEDNYLRYNNPHKTSLYIVSGLPIVIWSKAAMADFVVSYNIGITIDSLDELEDRLYNISENEYRTMRNNCLYLREQLLNGYHLKRAIDKILETMNEQ